jgi:hypothetical protein
MLHEKSPVFSGTLLIIGNGYLIKDL